MSNDVNDGQQRSNVNLGDPHHPLRMVMRARRRADERTGEDLRGVMRKPPRPGARNQIPDGFVQVWVRPSEGPAFLAWVHSELIPEKPGPVVDLVVMDVVNCCTLLLQGCRCDTAGTEQVGTHRLDVQRVITVFDPVASFAQVTFDGLSGDR